MEIHNGSLDYIQLWNLILIKKVSKIGLLWNVVRAINDVSGDDTRDSACHEAIFTGQLCEIINDRSFPRINRNQLQKIQFGDY